MNEVEKGQILDRAKLWFCEKIAEKHVKNTRKLGNPKAFNINPFLVNYLANYLTGNNSAESIAKALIYPRILGTSITTSFGASMQNFTNQVLAGFASVVSGIDIEFVDSQDHRRKYCQLKAGPNTINKDDVETIHNHFRDVRHLARTNQLNIGLGDLVVGVLYGEPQQLSGHYKRLENEYDHPILVGQDFWLRLTGDENFYADLTTVFANVANEFDATDMIAETVQQLAASEVIQNLAKNTSLL
ncbi:MAG TPA: restriction endonuclease [Anaerolineae bacterium]|nr:restriction endonuclease [Anaerolineae bacterium]